MQLFNPVAIAKSLLTEKLKLARLAVDATAGNGHDTLFLAKNMSDEAVVMAFDLQDSAIKAAEKLLAEHGLLKKVRLYCLSHTYIKDYIKDTGIDVAMFNLGYLPGENHKVVTKAASTMAAIKDVIERLTLGGILSVITYPGHEEGQVEEQEIKKYFAALANNSFNVIRTEMFNHVNNPPVLYLLEKVKKR